MVHEPAKSANIVPTITIFDPSQSWGMLSKNSFRSNKEEIIKFNEVFLRCNYKTHGDCLSANVVLVIVPDRGFDRSTQRALNSTTVEPWHQRLYAAVIDEEMMKPISRGGVGFENLTQEVKRQYDAPLLLIHKGHENEILPDLIDLLGKCALRSLENEQAFYRIKEIEKIAYSRPRISTTIENAADILQIITIGKEARAFRKELQNLSHKIEKGSNDSLLSDEWKSLVRRSRDCCIKITRAASVHSFGAEEIIKDIVNVLPPLKTLLDEKFKNPPIKALNNWVKQLTQVLEKPELVLPVIGVFSSGKTTLINHILGPSPGGHARLRTSQNHNTAMLTYFHYDSREHMRFSWHSEIDLDLMWYMDPAKRPILAPTTGTIASIKEDSDGWLILIDNKQSECQWVRFDKDHPPLTDIQKGVAVHAGMPLSKGIDRKEIHSGLCAKKCTASIHTRPWAIASLLEFIETKKLTDVRLEIEWRRPAKTGEFSFKPFVLESKSHKQGEQDFSAAITALRDIIQPNKKRLYAQIRIPEGKNVFPVSVRVHASLDENNCALQEKTLVSEEDWTWFQGPPDMRVGLVKPGTGFSETPEAAWLIKQADLYVNAPLFKLVSLVDTPGLDSISEHHDRTTEQCIQRGQAFLVLVRLGKDTVSGATERTFHMITQSLTAQRIQREEWANRIFVVLNWFRRSVGARNKADAKASADRFRKHLRTILYTEHPQVFVVELSQSQLDENPQELLGYPSLAALKQKLGAFIGKQGVALRLNGLKDNLEKIYRDMKRDLEQQQRSLSFGSAEDVKMIQASIKKMQENGSTRKTIMQEIIEGELESVLEPLQFLRCAFCANYDNKEEFESLLISAERFMIEYNCKRNEFEREIQSKINHYIYQMVKNSLGNPPRIQINRDSLKCLPEMPSSNFANKAKSIRDNWPWAITRFGLFLVNMDSYANVKRDELRDAFLPESLDHTLTKTATMIECSLKESAAEALDDAVSQLEMRLADLTANANDQEIRKDAIELERKKLRQFKPIVHQTVQVISSIVAQLHNSDKHTGGKS